MKITISPRSSARFLRKGAFVTAALSVLAAGSVRAVDNNLSWYGAGSGSPLGGSGDWALASSTPTWFDGVSYYTWAAAVPLFGPDNTHLIVANFGGTAGTVTLNNLGPNGSTFIGTVNVTTGGYNFTGTGIIALAASNRVHFIVDTADNAPVSLEAGVSLTLRASTRIFQIGAGDTLNIAGVIDNGRINKTGAGVLRLSGANAFPNPVGIDVTEGTLLLNNTAGSGSGNAGVTVASGATLGGTGSIATTAARTVVVSGTLSPGDNSASAFTIGFGNIDSRLVFQAGSALNLTLGTVSDSVVFANEGDWLSGSGLVTLNLTQAEGFSYSSTYTIFDNVTTADFTFLNVTGYDTTNYQANFALAGNDYVVSFAPVPEPSTIALLAAGTILMLWKLRRRNA